MHETERRVEFLQVEKGGLNISEHKAKGTEWNIDKGQTRAQEVCRNVSERP